MSEATPQDSDEDSVSARLPSSPVESHTDPRRWTALTIMLVAVFMDLLDVSVINIAVPSIQVALGATYADVQWMTAGYSLAFALLLITGGRLGDLFGRKRLFLAGIALFTAASLLCGLATTPPVLVAGRILQGLAAALMVPQVLSSIAVSFPERERGKVVGLYGAVSGLALVSGPVLGGLLVSADVFGLGWRAVFLINVPVGLVSIVVAARSVQESRVPRAVRLDLVGLALGTVGLGLVMFPLVQGRELGWSPWTLGLLAAAVIVLGAFVAQQVRADRRQDAVTVPLVALAPFRSRTYVVGLVAILLLQAVPAGFSLIWTLHVQLGLGWSAWHAGVTTVPTALAAAIVGGLSMQVIVPRLGRRALLLGPVLLAVGIGLTGWIAVRSGTDLSSWSVAGPFALIGVGLGLLIAPLTALLLNYVAAGDAGSASGIINTTQQLGAAVGIALVGALFFGLVTGAGASRLDDTRLRGDLASAAVEGPASERIVVATQRCASARAAEQDPAAVVPACRELRADPVAALPSVAAAVDRALAGDRAVVSGGSLLAASLAAVAGLFVVLGLVLLLPRDFGRGPGAVGAETGAPVRAQTGERRPSEQ